jgi:chain length determinant protein tyrosine kinase EpsG
MTQPHDFASTDATAHAPQGGTRAAQRSIGDIISELRNLSADQVERVLAHQRETGMRFGEAAIALGLASTSDVLLALTQQFHYPYAPDASGKLGAELVTLSQTFSPQAEAFRALRSQMMMRVFDEKKQPPRALALISPQVGDGKSYVAANLAVVLAQLGGRTLLVDADMRNPRQHEIFKLNVEAGLSAILSGRTEKQVVQQVPGIASLFVLPVGAVPPNPLELVERGAFGLLIGELTTKFDHVLVDTPAAVLGSDGQVIAARCGAALGLARRNTSRVKALRDLTESIAQTPAELVGFIVNEH